MHPEIKRGLLITLRVWKEPCYAVSSSARRFPSDSVDGVELVDYPASSGGKRKILEDVPGSLCKAVPEQKNREQW